MFIYKMSGWKLPQQMNVNLCDKDFRGKNQRKWLWYDSKVTRGKGGAHVALYWIYVDSEVRLSVKSEILK